MILYLLRIVKLWNKIDKPLKHQIKAVKQNFIFKLLFILLTLITPLVSSKIPLKILSIYGLILKYLKTHQQMLKLKY